MTETPQEIEQPVPITLTKFFENAPPGKTVLVKDIAQKKEGSLDVVFPLVTPDLRLFCTDESCTGFRIFSREGDRPYVSTKEPKIGFVTYTCRNCARSTKIYALWISLHPDARAGEMHKFGEMPPFGPLTPPRVISLIGPDKDYFLKGRRSENQGLGIGAFAYYRRVVENQKNRILEKIIRVSERINAPQEVITDLRTAISEIQFSKAVASIKHGIPQILLINGHNPLILLHSALSQGLHTQSDSQCLEIATSIRVILTELAERITQALKDEAELNTAVTRLLQASAQKPPDSKKNS